LKRLRDENIFHFEKLESPNGGNGGMIFVWHSIATFAWKFKSDCQFQWSSLSCPQYLKD
jgi:hypothetical protein